MPRNLKSLKPGERFLIPTLGKRGTLLSLGLGSARVRYDGQPKETTLTTRWGERVTFAKSKVEEVNISLATQVVRLVRKHKEEKET